MSHIINARGWRKLSIPDLDALILSIRRSAVSHHLSIKQWRELDRMRQRLAKLLKDQVAA
jgi:hypothetical protein